MLSSHVLFSLIIDHVHITSQKINLLKATPSCKARLNGSQLYKWHVVIYDFLISFDYLRQEEHPANFQILDTNCL